MSVRKSLCLYALNFFILCVCVSVFLEYLYFDPCGNEVSQSAHGLHMLTLSQVPGFPLLCALLMLLNCHKYKDKFTFIHVPEIFIR